MRSTMTPLVAAGAGPWFPLDTLEAGFGVGFYCAVLSGSSLTYKIQHGFYDPAVEEYFDATITRSSTTLTAVIPHLIAAVAGDSMVIVAAGTGLDGTWPVATVSVSGTTTTLTATVANTGATVATAGAHLLFIHVEDDPVVTGKTAGTSGNIAFPVNAIRLNVTAFTSGAVSLTVNQGVFGGAS